MFISTKKPSAMGNVVMKGPVNGIVPPNILKRTKELAPKTWSKKDFIIGQICVTYDYTHQAWTDEPIVNFVFDVDNQIKTMLKWADHIIKEDRKAAHKLRKMWRKAPTYEAKNWSCAQGGEISEYLFDKYDDEFL